jgi:plastocyanin
VARVASPAPLSSAAAPQSLAGVSPTTTQPEVSIVEPAFRPPQEWTYTPDQLSVKVGTRVVWTNTGAVAHTVTADDGKSFDSGSIGPKATFAFTPTEIGTFAYHCTFHPWMKATLTVTP